MTTTVSPAEATARRAAKAHAILEGAGQWGRGRLADGECVYLIPSCTTPNLYFATDTERCGCPDWKRRSAIDPLAPPCKHAQAARWYVVRLLGHGAERRESRQERDAREARLANLAAMVRND